MPGILGPVTANPNILQQGILARQQPRKQLEGYELAQAIGMIPGAGLLSVAGDVNEYIEKPDTRGALPYLLTALGAVPFLGAMAKMAGPRPAGILAREMGGIAYHGSPHKFEAFDSSKIGTGEGAQAYGHGLYFAENPAVAREYSKVDPSTLPPPNRIFRGKELVPGTPEYHAGTLVEHSTLAKARKDVASWIAEGHPDQKVLAGWKTTLDTLNSASSKADFKVGPSAHLYKADIPDSMISKMLDWDKPLSQQPESVQMALQPFLDSVLARANHPNVANRTLPAAVDAIKNKTVTGEQLYRWVGSAGPSQNSASRLTELGIPGIKYLDQGSRAGGHGTSNFVLFPGMEKDVRILERQ